MSGATTFFSRLIQRWGKLPISLLNGFDLKDHRYAFIGTEEWFMYPLIQPGSLVLIDESRRKVGQHRLDNEFERPIYFLRASQRIRLRVVHPQCGAVGPAAAPGFDVLSGSLRLSRRKSTSSAR